MRLRKTWQFDACSLSGTSNKRISQQSSGICSQALVCSFVYIADAQAFQVWGGAGYRGSEKLKRSDKRGLGILRWKLLSATERGGVLSPVLQQQRHNGVLAVLALLPQEAGMTLRRIKDRQEYARWIMFAYVVHVHQYVCACMQIFMQVLAGARPPVNQVGHLREIQGCQTRRAQLAVVVQVQQVWVCVMVEKHADHLRVAPSCGCKQGSAAMHVLRIGVDHPLEVFE